MQKESLEAIMQAMQGTSIKECEITGKELYVRLVRDTTAAPAAKKPAASPVAPPAAPVAEDKGPTTDITSAWVGHFYRGAKPKDKALLKLRDMVKEGQQVGIVVTMNVVHQIVSEVAGKLTEILVEDGQAVEYGQPLLRISAEQ